MTTFVHNAINGLFDSVIGTHSICQKYTHRYAWSLGGALSATLCLARGLAPPLGCQTRPSPIILMNIPKIYKRKGEGHMEGFF